MTQLHLDFPPIEPPKKAKRRKDPDFEITRFEFVAHRDVLRQWPTIKTDIDSLLTAELEAWARQNDLVLTETRSGKEREITAEPRGLVNQRAEDAKRVEQLAEARRRMREALDRASSALATPGD
jgi:hypothetical protein